MLMLQAVMPFMLEVLPGAVNSVPMVLATCRFECYVACGLYSWMPVFNTLTPLLLIRTYRDFSSGRWSGDKHSSVSTHVQTRNMVGTHEGTHNL